MSVLIFHFVVAFSHKYLNIINSVSFIMMEESILNQFKKIKIKMNFLKDK